MTWGPREEHLHPRDPRNGEFTDRPGGGGDWVKAISGRIGPRGRREHLANMVSGQETGRTEYAGGNSGRTYRVSFRDGDVIQKLTVEEYAVNEERVGHIGEALGIPIPTVIRDDRRVPAKSIFDAGLWMEHVDGDVAGSVAGLDERRHASTDAGHLIGLLDVLTINADRHSGNWILTPSGPVGIDHSHVFMPGRIYGGRPHTEAPDLGQYNAFARNYIEVDDTPQADLRTVLLGGGGPSRPPKPPRWIDNDLHPADLDVVRERINALIADGTIPASATVGLAERIDALQAHAKGKRRRIS